MSEPKPSADDDPEDHSSPDTDATDRGLVALVDESADGRAYTVFPAKADAADLLTTWLTVDDDSIYDRDEWR